jgi:CRISPR/Cas system-associated endonuclease Cas1
MPMYFKKPSLILKQYKAKSNGKDIEIVKYLIGLKLKTHDMSHLVKNLNKVKTIKEVIAIEGTTANKYYSKWIFNNKWN